MLSAFSLVLHTGLSTAPIAAPEPSWVAAAGCPDRARGTELLQRFLGGRPPSVPVRVVLSTEAGGFAGTVELDGATRTLHANDCETLARAVALVVAVSLDPVAAASAMTEPEPPSPGPDLGVPEPDLGVPEPDLGVPEPDRPLDAREPDRSLAASEPDRTATARRPVLASADRADAAPEPTTHAIALGGGAGLALLPTPTAAARLGYAVTRGGFRLQTDLTYAPPRTLTYPDEPTVGGRFQSVGLAVRACFVPGSTRVAAPLCAGLEGGPVIGRGVGIDRARSPVDAWVGGLASGAVVVRVHSRVALTAAVELIASLRRPAFHVGARETLFRVPVAGLRGLLGLELRVW